MRVRRTTALTMEIECGRHRAHRIHTNTPAEQRTGISDRAAAALEDVAKMRAETMSLLTHARLDRIEAALRERAL